MSELLATDTQTYDDLVIQADPLETAYKTLAIGAGTLARGSVLGMVSANEQHILCDKTAEDGTQTARVILAEAVILSAQATVQALVYTEAVINEKAIALAVGTVADDVREDLQSNGIILKAALDPN